MVSLRGSIGILYPLIPVAVGKFAKCHFIVGKSLNASSVKIIELCTHILEEFILG